MEQPDNPAEVSPETIAEFKAKVDALGSEVGLMATEMFIAVLGVEKVGALVSFVVMDPSGQELTGLAGNMGVAGANALLARQLAIGTQKVLREGR